MANRSRLTRMFLAVFLVVGVLGACSTSDDGSADGAEADEDTESGSPNTVAMELIAYNPEDLEVAAGTEVTWTQGDAGFHTVTSGTVEQGGAGVTVSPDGIFDSGDIETDDSFSFTFDEPGTFPYYCEIHPATMRGEVSVS